VSAELGVEIVRLGPFVPTLEQGVAAADVGLASGASAFVAFNDLLAIGALRRLERRGIDVPGAISVVG
jgi:DNA-binding LacI/PurR family transcriptional regulator